MPAKYRKENCSSSVRDFCTERWGREIIVTGTHSYEWSITIRSHISITSIRFRTRIEAVKLINELKRRT